MIAHTSLKMAQTVSLIAPPLYIATAILRRNPLKPFTIKRLLNTTIAWTGLGAAAGGALGYGRLIDEPETAILARVEKLVRLPDTTREIVADFCRDSVRAKFEQTTIRSSEPH